ncbi:hypothetical protein, conserved [Plasmodium gonderi]|uniref:Tubby C-terminal domain-containing protein n=1 Tax=Plasmodium gonderi TaxID=77519 RepID=A0A1Y1JRR1_PLAGO|nr:hypothetical protein, conserved [Plasmodium gonderi]GAW83153.1 hypothetical protein, conserved [Plasmodium gonderi]
MDLHKSDWEDRQFRLEKIIKKEFYYKQNDIKKCEKSKTGGFISRKKYNMVEPCKCCNCEYIILVITEYMKKECVLDRYVMAYKKLYENIDLYIHKIRNKSDIDYIANKYFLLKNDMSHLKHLNKKFTTGDCKDIEMETYTISVILTIRTKILNSLPMLKEALKNLSQDEHNDYYVSSRIGIIEQIKNKIYNYIVGRKKDHKYETNNVRRERTNKTQVYENIHMDETSMRMYDLTPDYKHGEGIIYHESDEINQFEHLIHRGSYNNDDIRDSFCNKIPIFSIDDRHEMHKDNPFAETRTIMKRSPELPECTNIICGGNSARLRKEVPMKFYEITITTNRNLISLRSILLLIEMVSLFHTYLMKYMMEKRKNEKINFVQLDEFRKKEEDLSCDESGYLLFYDIILGKVKDKKKTEEEKEEAEEEEDEEDEEDEEEEEKNDSQKCKQIYSNGPQNCRNYGKKSSTSDNTTSFDYDNEEDSNGAECAPIEKRAPIRFFSDGDNVYTKRIIDRTQQDKEYTHQAEPTQWRSKYTDLDNNVFISDAHGAGRDADYTNRISDCGSLIADSVGKCKSYTYQDSDYNKLSDIRHVNRTDKKVVCDSIPVSELKEEPSYIEEKEVEEIIDYINYMFSFIMNECDTYLNIELLFTLHAFELSYMFNVLKKLILGKEIENEFLVMLTYCGYKIENKEIIDHCFWKLISVFENEDLPDCWVILDNKSDNQLRKKYNEMKNNLRDMKQKKEEIEMEKNKKKQKNSQEHYYYYYCCYKDGIFYEALNIFQPSNYNSIINNITEVDMNKGNLYFNKNLIDKRIFLPLIEKTKKEFHHYNDVPKGYIINEIQRLRNFNDDYSCCYILKNNKKEKILMGFKKRGENKVFVYKYNKNVKKIYKTGPKKKIKSFFNNISGFLGVLICNFTGMKIKIYDNGISEKYAHFFPAFERKNVISIRFESNIISELPRHFICNIYKENKNIKIIYENKCPVWNDEKEIYELPFYGRVKLASAKNLQLILKKCVIAELKKASFIGKSINDVIEYVSNDHCKLNSLSCNAYAECATDNHSWDLHPHASTYEDNCSDEERPKKKVIKKNFPFDIITNNFKKKKEGKFEIVNNDEEEIFLIFGKNSKDYFTLDFRHPLSSFEAFSIAISSLLKKKAVS